jgi:hypothetical protein
MCTFAALAPTESCCKRKRRPGWDRRVSFSTPEPSLRVRRVLDCKGARRNRTVGHVRVPFWEWARVSGPASRRVGRERSKVSHPKFVVDRHREANGCATRPPPHAPRPHDSRAAQAAFNGRQLKGKSLRLGSTGSRIQVHPEQACIALRAHEHRETFFPLDADFAIRFTLQQPKFLCSSQLGETCPPQPGADRRRLRRSQSRGWSHSWRTTSLSNDPPISLIRTMVSLERYSPRGSSVFSYSVTS